MNIAVCYFSGTGNTAYVAKMIAKRLSESSAQCSCNSIEEPGCLEAMQNANTIVIGYPVYGSCIPRIMREFLDKNLEIFKNKSVSVFATQFLFSGDGAALAGRRLKRAGASIICLRHFRMPNNLCGLRIYPVRNNSIKDKRLIQKTEKKTGNFCAEILAGKGRRQGNNLISTGLGFLLQRALFSIGEQQYAEAIRFNAEACTRCGLCVNTCPTANLHLAEPSEALPISNDGLCTLCYRCINNCPERAISFFSNRQPESQYIPVWKHNALRIKTNNV